MEPLDQTELRELVEFRSALRRFLRASEEQAMVAGLTPARHQLLLTVASHPAPVAPTITDVAETLLLRHHSAVGLIDRTAEGGLVERVPDPRHHRVVRVRLTPTGEQRLRALTPLDREELDRLGRYPELFGDAVPQADLKPPLRRRRFLHRRRGLVGCGRGRSRVADVARRLALALPAGVTCRCRS